MLEDGVESATAICLAPQNSRTSVGLYKRAVLAAAGDKIKIDFVESWHDHPRLIEAFAEKLRAARAKASDATVLFTAHSVPCRTINGQNDGDPYSVQCKHTAELVAKAAGLKTSDWEFAFQSQGMSGGPWIGPTVEATLDGLAAAGKKSVLMQPIGFVCDHVEVLYDIDIAFREHAEKLGMKLSRAESLNDSPLFADALADLARSNIASTVAVS
jgi:ferrochelatase